MSNDFPIEFRHEVTDRLKSELAAALGARLIADTNSDVHLPVDQEDECYRRQVHLTRRSHGVVILEADVLRFIELAMEVVFDRTWNVAHTIGGHDALKAKGD